VSVFSRIGYAAPGVAVTETDNLILPGGPVSGSIANFESLAEKVGNTPLLEIPMDAGSPVRLMVKLEGYNPTGSVKDRACVAMLRTMIQDPEWDASKTILDSSSGNMGCSIAYFGRALGTDVRIVSSRKLTAEKRLYIEYFGGGVEIIGELTIEGNKYCNEVAASDPGKWYFLDQLHNPVNPIAHAMGTGPEILAQVPDVTAVVGSIGSGGTMLGVGRHLKQANKDIKIFAVEAAPGTRLPGTAALVDGDYRTPFIEEGFAHNVFDFSVQVSDAEAIDIAKMLSATGLFGGLQTYAVIAAARRVVRSHGLRGDVVVISGDTGWKNLDALILKVRGRAAGREGS
jgi:[CysO sulfur-carrier protein]-thiocarboxylate-dependent cysteine synthase